MKDLLLVILGPVVSRLLERLGLRWLFVIVVFCGLIGFCGYLCYKHYEMRLTLHNERYEMCRLKEQFEELKKDYLLLKQKFYSNNPKHNNHKTKTKPIQKLKSRRHAENSYSSFGSLFDGGITPPFRCEFEAFSLPTFLLLLGRAKSKRKGRLRRRQKRVGWGGK